MSTEQTPRTPALEEQLAALLEAHGVEALLRALEYALHEKSWEHRHNRPLGLTLFRAAERMKATLEELADGSEP